MLIGLGSLAFSQLVEDSAEESPPPLPGGALRPLPGEAPKISGAEGSATDRINSLRDDFNVARRALARARQMKDESDRRSKAELERIRKDLEQSKEELRLAQRVVPDDDPNRRTKLNSLQGQVNEALAQLKMREQRLSSEQAYADNKLHSLEEELKASEGILSDSLTEGASPNEALPAVSLLQENLKHTHEDIVSSLNDSTRREQGVMEVAQGFGSTLAAAQQEVATAREIARSTGRAKELEAAEIRGNLRDAMRTVTEFQLEESQRLRPEIGELDINASRSKQNLMVPSETIRQLQDEVDASQGLHASLNEDVDKLRTELKQAFRKIITMQMKLEESDKLVIDLERQRDSLLQSKNEGITGVEGMNRMVERLEQELVIVKNELSQARDSLNAEKVKSAAVINNQTADLQRTKAELERVKALASVEGREAVSMLELEEELNRTKSQLLNLQRQNLESGTGTEDIKNELKDALLEIVKLQVELSGKDELEKQLAMLEKTMTKDTPATPAASPQHVNELIRNLSAAKSALQQARSDQEKVRLSLSKQVAALEDELQQSRDNLDLAQVDMARKELEFSDLVKGLENELAGTEQVLRQASSAHTQGTDVIEIMDADLGAAQTRMQRITDEMEKERIDAARHIRDLQLELQASRLRQESVLEEIREKDLNITTKGDELQRALARNSKLEEQLDEVEAMSHTLSELNSVLRSTESVQNVNADQANALVAQLRDEMEQAKVEALLAKQSKEDVERRAKLRVNSLEKQLEDTQDQLEQTKGQFHEVTGEGAGLIAELKANLSQAEAEIALLKQAGAGETVGTEKLASQLQEALGAIQVLQHNLAESERVNAEVDDLRLRLAAAMEANIGDKELDEAETISLQKKMRTLEMELAMAQQSQSGDRVNAQQLFSKLKDQLEASRAKVAAMQARLGQSEDSTVETIANLEEQLARSNVEKQDIEQRMHKLLQGKTESVEALERELVLTKSRLDELDQQLPGGDSDQIRISTLEQQLLSTKNQLDMLHAQRNAVGVGSTNASALEKQLVDTQNRLNGLLAVAMKGAPGMTPSSAVVGALEAQLDDARLALNKLQGALAQRDRENAEIETQLEKALENMMDMQMAGDGGTLRQELEELKRQLVEAKAVGPVAPSGADAAAIDALQLEIARMKSELDKSSPNQAADQSGAVAAMRLEIAQLKSELEQENNDQSGDFAALHLEIDQLKKDLQQAALGTSDQSATASNRLEGELETATEYIFDLQTQLAASKKQLQDMKDLEVARTSGDDTTVAVLSKKLEEAANAIRALKEQKEKSDTTLAKRKDDAAMLDEELEKSFQAMQKLKDEKDILATERNALSDQVSGLEDLNSKLTAANNASRHTSEADGRLARERDDLIRRNLALQTDLEKYKNEVRRLQESLAAPRVSAGNAANMQAQITAMESQLQVAKAAEVSALGDLDRVGAQLKDSMRQVMVLETNLGQAEGRLKQLENTASPSFAARVEPASSAESSATRALRDEVLRLRAELEAAQAAGGSRSQTEDRLRDTSQKLLAAQMELERASQQISILGDQANQVEARRRSDVEREKAANQMVTLLNDKLKREEAKNLALQEGIRKAREVIASLRGEPGAPPATSSRLGTSRRTSMFDASPRTTSFNPRSSPSSSPSRFAVPVEPSTSASVRRRPLPSRSTSDDWRNRTRSVPPSSRESNSFRSTSPVGRKVDRGSAKVDFEVVVQFLNNQNKPAPNVEFFLTQGAGIEDVTAGTGIRLPAGINSGAELWARSIHRGYNYPGVAAKIRDSLSQAAVARFKTNSSGMARLENLPVGRYVVIGAAPMGAIGVVWSQPFDLSDGDKVRLDLRNVAFAK